LLDILIIALCAMLCGAETFTDMERFGLAKMEWLQEHLGLDLEHGIPSHDTFGRLFAILDPDAFAKSFRDWTQSVQRMTQGQVIAVDGKTLRRSFDTANGNAALHLVSAWSHKSRLVLGQRAVREKSNEITAVPELLALLDLHGCIVTVDALNCQKNTAQQVLDRGGDYLFALKDNHPLLRQEVADYLDWSRRRISTLEVPSAKGVEAARSNLIQGMAETHNYGHGRREVRRCFALDATNGDWAEAAAQWPGLRSIVLVEAERSLSINAPDEATTWSVPSVEQRYYLSSLPCDAPQLLQSARDHWGIENSLHWVLDVGFNEDSCRIRRDNAPLNLAVLRHWALNALRQENTDKSGVKARRLRAGWDNNYLLKLLAG
jgi:predicted transposase YbfD/YdcC